MKIFLGERIQLRLKRKTVTGKDYKDLRMTLCDLSLIKRLIKLNVYPKREREWERQRVGERERERWEWVACDACHEKKNRV